ncbi:dihydroorotase [Methylotuvimicrobium alcaliphilum]|uniref:Dihydroorotase-like protein putative aspartate carbamoyltransferase non-catalytic chain n=1 Tax=Methylotuvimicrobium alcaliphilum (strain DSM 19304 / NCIMB 14124 / VKM B-2133 / 20Z) TaxID=1091494 RepID=G4SZU3_META2|nr:dihydroorotase [Methylotuvimicrobium alcaliphilum]CCE25543.1 dihydroorotase-like protein; putative aspartate carbamoyltransferase non-catalytic chain [Methylotuvimicrobium alcaliphilum 20Z]
MKRILIEQGRVIDPAHSIDRTGPVYVADGKILALFEKPNGFEPDSVIDASGQIVCPGFIDISTRLRQPGQSHKATFQTETKAAAAGGITTLILQPDTRPVIDTPAITELVKELAENSNYRQILPVGALTQNLEGQELSSMLALQEAGCIAVGNGGRPISNLLVLRRAMEYAASHDLLLIYRPNEHSLSNEGCAHEGAFATRYGLPGIPETAETIALSQCLELAELTGCRVHFGQLSCRRSVIKIQQAQKYGLSVSADIAAHQLHLTENDMKPFDSAYHVLPPLRSKQDKLFLRKALMQGTIGTLCSDHQPHDLDAKLGAFPETEPGISALETLLPLMLKLVDEKLITLSQGIAALTQTPAKVLRLESGTLTPGKSADICIFDPGRRWQVDHSTWYSKGINTPYWGETLTGRVSATLQSGKIIFQGVFHD